MFPPSSHNQNDLLLQSKMTNIAVGLLFVDVWHIMEQKLNDMMNGTSTLSKMVRVKIDVGSGSCDEMGVVLRYRVDVI
jgi:hypothetical protein